MIKVKQKICCECNQLSYIFSKGRCKQCASKSYKKLEPKTILKINKPINKQSKKRAVEQLQYSANRLIFLAKEENKICFIEGCNRLANSVEHQRGRVGFADDYARENNISLFLDERFWKPCCIEHNLELETNPELSRKYQLSKISGKEKIKK